MSDEDSDCIYDDEIFHNKIINGTRPVTRSMTNKKRKRDKNSGSFIDDIMKNYKKIKAGGKNHTESINELTDNYMKKYIKNKKKGLKYLVDKYTQKALETKEKRVEELIDSIEKKF